RTGGRRDLDQVEIGFLGQTQCVLHGNDSDLLTVGPDESDLGHPDAVIDAGLGADGTPPSFLGLPGPAAPHWAAARPDPGFSWDTRPCRGPRKSENPAGVCKRGDPTENGDDVVPCSVERRSHRILTAVRDTQRRTRTYVGKAR